MQDHNYRIFLILILILISVTLVSASKQIIFIKQSQGVCSSSASNGTFVYGDFFNQNLNTTNDVNFNSIMINSTERTKGINAYIYYNSDEESYYGKIDVYDSSDLLQTTIDNNGVTSTRINSPLIYSSNTLQIQSGNNEDNYIEFIGPGYSQLMNMYMRNITVFQPIISSNNITATNFYGNLNANKIISGNITPLSNNTYDLGSPNFVWKDIYVGNSSINIGNKKLSNVNGILNWDNINISTTNNWNNIQNIPSGFADGIDDTGGSSNTPNINYTTAVVSTTSNTIYEKVLTLSLPTAATKYIINCRMVSKGAATTTGVQYRINTTGSPSTVDISLSPYGSALGYAGTSTSTNALAVATSTVTYAPSMMSGYVVTNGGTSLFSVEMKSEVSASLASINRGSWCEAIQVS